MAKKRSAGVKIFRFNSFEYRPARWLQFADLVVAAHSLGEAKNILKVAGIDTAHEWQAVAATSPAEEVALAIAHPGQPVWMDLDRPESGWHVGGRDAIEAYIRKKYGDGPYPRMKRIGPNL